MIYAYSENNDKKIDCRFVILRPREGSVSQAKGVWERYSVLSWHSRYNKRIRKYRTTNIAWVHDRLLNQQSKERTMFTIPSFQFFRASMRFMQAVLMLCLLGLAVTALGATEEETRVKGEPLRPCPGSPNCVSTIDPAESHTIAPYRYRKSLQETKAELIHIFSEFPRTELVEEKGGYLHFEARSFLFGFVDDVEFWFDADTKTIHFRSASRSGYYDFGVNRKRMEDLRLMLNDKV